MSLVLQSKSDDYQPHPEGIYPAICLDVIDLGDQETEWQGIIKMVQKLRLVFESEAKLPDGRNCSISKTFTASLHPKARLADFLGKWRGRPVGPGESIDLQKLIGANCTLVISHNQNTVGRTYAAIDAISKPTKKLVPSGCYDPAAARQRIEEWKAKQPTMKAPAPVPTRATIQTAAPKPTPTKSHAATTPQEPAFDPEIGF